MEFTGQEINDRSCALILSLLVAHRLTPRTFDGTCTDCVSLTIQKLSRTFNEEQGLSSAWAHAVPQDTLNFLSWVAGSADMTVAAMRLLPFSGK